LRILLRRYQCLNPRLLDFDFNTCGKPILAFPVLDTPLQFNLAHSCDLALYAFTYSRQVGIDVEYKRAAVDYEALARIAFSPNEQATLYSLHNKLKQGFFYTRWTLKEAYIKAKGKGMSIPLDQFDVSCQSGEPTALLQSREDPHEIRRWALRELAPGHEYAGLSL
jgi:4'-phosphopantetheinyl transferase